MGSTNALRLPIDFPQRVRGLYRAQLSIGECRRASKCRREYGKRRGLLEDDFTDELDRIPAPCTRGPAVRRIGKHACFAWPL